MKKCRLCGELREDHDLRRTKAKKTLLIMLCGMVWRGRLRVGEAQELYNQSLVSQNILLCINHFCETASYISDAVAAICDTVTLNLFTMPGQVLGKIATRFETYQRAIDPHIPLSAYDWLLFIVCLGMIMSCLLHGVVIMSTLSRWILDAKKLKR
ncbi:hypothetical protein OSTOST_16599, partial [Ostertagia ostertagi]